MDDLTSTDGTERLPHCSVLTWRRSYSAVTAEHSWCRPVTSGRGIFGWANYVHHRPHKRSGRRSCELSCYETTNQLSFGISPRAIELWRRDMMEHERDARPAAGAVYGLAGAVALIVGLAAFAVPRPAGALPAYAQQTGLSCGRCHVNAAGGGARTRFGNAFMANGHKVPSAAKPGKASVHGETDSVSSPPPDSVAYSPPLFYFGDFRGARPPNAYSEIRR